MKKSFVIGLVIILAVAAGGAGFLVLRKKDTPAPATSQTTASNPDTQTALQPTTTSEQKTPAATITYTDNGFAPASINVHAGDVVKVVNNSSHNLQFSSDPHPVHTKDTELNQQTLRPGESQTFDVTKKGTFGFHDHIDSTKTGTITVE